MGFDIHAHWEVKMGSEWLPSGEPRIDRNYTLFSFMADVRNDGDIVPIPKPRGLPHDVTGLVRAYYDHYGLVGTPHTLLIRW